MTLSKMGTNFVDLALTSWQPSFMAISIANVLDTVSAEYVKGLAQVPDVKDPLSLWRAAMKLDPDNSSIVSHLAVSLLDQECFQEVVALMRTALHSNPRDLHLLNLFGVALFRLDAYDLAADVFRYLLDIEPTYPNASASLQNAIERSSTHGSKALGLSDFVNALILDGRSRPRPSLSVCMIVKDEAEFITDAIQSVEMVADEVVVVDTGSTDNTVALAEAAGARVEYFAWVGDFARARNASLEHATSDWILVLDADERLRAESAVNLRAVLESRFNDAIPTVFCVQIKNYTRDGVYQSDGFSGRLFRNDERLRFEGKVHEEVGREFGTDYRLDISFDHFGADPQVMAEKGKDERNLALLELKLAESPDDLVTWFYLASQHWIGSRTQSALEAFQQVAQLFEQDPSQFGVSVVHIPVAYSYVGLMRTQMQLEKFKAAALSADKATAMLDANPDLLFQAGLAYLYVDRLADAAAAFETCLKTPISGFSRIGMHDPSIQEWRAAKMLGDVYYAQSDQSRALETYMGIYETVPMSDPDYVVMIARLVELASAAERFDVLPKFCRMYLARRPTEIGIAVQVAQQLAQQEGGAALSLSFLESIQNELPNVVDNIGFVCFTGQLMQNEGDIANAIEWYLRAAELGENSAQFWLNLGQLLVQVQEFEAAQQAFDRAKASLDAGG